MAGSEDEPTCLHSYSIAVFVVCVQAAQYEPAAAAHRTWTPVDDRLLLRDTSTQSTELCSGNMVFDHHTLEGQHAPLHESFHG